MRLHEYSRTYSKRLVRFVAKNGNPLSAYHFESQLNALAETPRNQVAQLIGILPEEIFFASFAFGASAHVGGKMLETCDNTKSDAACHDFESLVKAPTAPLSRPAVAPKVQILPFNELPWRTFEQLCCRLISLLPGIVGTPHLYGKPGDDQQGIDILARFNDSNGPITVCFQCKNHKYFSPLSFTEAITQVTFPADKTTFVIACPAGKSLRDIERGHPNIELWDQEDLSLKLKSKTVLVSDFFHPSWVEAFCTPSDSDRPFNRASAFCVPHPPETFIGRNKELEWLCDSLLRSRITILEGVGGIGKSALLQRALADAHGLATVWLNVESYGNLTDVETALATGLCSNGFPSNSGQGQWTSIKHAPIRIVFDGVDRLPASELGQLIQFLENIIKLTDHTRIVVTSQITIPWLHGNRLELKRMLDEDQLQLFDALLRASACPFDREQQAFNWLASFSDGHPLTIRLISALINHFRSESSVMERLNSMGANQLVVPLLKEHSRSTSLSKCLLVSYELCSAVQRTLLCYISNHPSGCWSEFATKSEGVSDFENDLALLRSLFLVQASRPYSTALRLSMLHPVRKFVQAQFEHDDQAAFLKVRMNVSGHLMVQSAVIYLHHLNAGDVEYAIFRTDLELPNYLEASAFANKRLKEMGAQEERDLHLRLLGGFGTAVAQYFFVTGLFKEGVQFVESGIQAHRELQMYESCASGLAMLGGLYTRMHDIEKSKEAFVRLKQLSIEHPNRSIQALALMHEGLMALEDGHCEEALTRLNASVGIYRELAREEKPKAETDEFNDYATYVGNMAIQLEGIGRALRQLGRLDEAIASLNEAVGLQHEIEDRINIGASLHQLGNLYAEKGDREQALKSYREAIDIFSSIGYAHHLSNSLCEFTEVALVDTALTIDTIKRLDRDLLIAGLNDIKDENMLILGAVRGDWDTAKMILRKNFSIIKLVSLSDHHELLCDWSKRIVEDVLSPFFEREEINAHSDPVGHLFQFLSDSVPGLSDSCRSEATLGFSHKGVSDRSQGFDWPFHRRVPIRRNDLLAPNRSAAN